MQYFVDPLLAMATSYEVHN